MKNPKQLVAIIAAIFIIGASGVWLVSERETTTEPSTDSTQRSEISQQEQKPLITVSDDQKTVSYEGITGMTALEVLKAGTNVTTEDSNFGEYVTSIAGIEADSTQEYWALYVNDQYADEGAGTLQTQDGDQIVWKLEGLGL